MGYGHIAGEHARRIQEFYVQYLNPYLNFHRPCGFATISVDEKGKRHRKDAVEDYTTPYEKLLSLRESGTLLKTRTGVGGVGKDREIGQRHRICRTYAASQDGVVTGVQDMRKRNL